jgi:phosphate transport system protein
MPIGEGDVLRPVGRGDVVFSRADVETDVVADWMIVVTHNLEDPKTISTAIELLLVGRNLERVADLSTNIGEDAVYLAEGKQIKHHLEDRPR